MKRLVKGLFLLMILNIAYGQQQVYEDNEVTSPATFRGGEVGLNQYINSNLNYPAEALEKNYTGEVKVVFMVNTYGNVQDIYADDSKVHELLRKEAIRVVQSTSGQWVPAQKGTTKVNMIFSVPIKFWIEETDKQEVAGKKPEMVQKKKWWKRKRNE